MNRKEKVLVIGNGFDLYHFLPTRYIDFLNVINRLLELENNDRLSSCQYIKYIWGPDSPIYQQDEFIQKCYMIHKQKMQSVELNRDKVSELVAISKDNLWIKYFQSCLDKNIGWIDFEKEIGNVISAVQELFPLDSMVRDLIDGIFFEQLESIDLKTINILEHLPFVVESEDFFFLKEEYCRKGLRDGYFISIDKEKILEELKDDLDNLAKALCMYLKEFVEKIAIDKNTDNPVFYNIDKVLNFNYTDTYRRLYSQDVEIKFIHGSIDDEEKGIVLGINNDTKDELQEMDASLIRFKKYYQRAMKDTFYSVEEFLNDENTEYQVAIVGHSIDITDKDILVGLMDHPRTKLTIYHHNDKAHTQQLVNLISLVGKSRFDELRNQKKIEFKQLGEFKERSLQMESVFASTEETAEYKIGREYRFLEDTNALTNWLLIGNELVKVSVRDHWTGIEEVKLVDYFLNLQERYNHSGLYNGLVKLVALFNDNRYCGAGVKVKYIKAPNESEFSKSQIEALFETDCDGITISITEMEVVDDMYEDENPCE